MPGRVRKPVELDFFDKQNVKVKKQKSEVNVTVIAKQPEIDRIWVAPSVVLSIRDKAHQLELSGDQLVCSGSEVIGDQYILVVLLF